MFTNREHFHGSDYEKIEAQYGISRENLVSFSANINPYGISPLLRETLSEHIDCITDYPDREYRKLREAIATYTGCDCQQVLVANGVTELISLFLQHLSPKKAFILGPTYSEYQREITLQGGLCSYYPLREEEDFRLDTDDFMENMPADTDVCVLCNPNNPTSSAISQKDLEKLLLACREKGVFLILDETYVEFAPEGEAITAIPFVDTFENLVVLRGTSKFFATPGLRLGYAVTGNNDLLQKIHGSRDPWSVHSLAAVAGEIMFSDADYIAQTRHLITTERKRLCSLLSESGAYRVYPSYGNFILLKILDPAQNAAQLFEKCLREGLLIRDCSDFPYLGDRYIRFCIMLPEDNDRLLRCLLK